MRLLCFRLLRSNILRKAWLVVLTLLAPVEAQDAKSSVKEYPAPLVRERQLVAVGAATETWELRWAAAPSAVCEPNDVSLTCPCTGFAYGEGGDLTLVRIRGKKEIDHLELTPVFERANARQERIAVLQRWEPNYQTDFEASAKDDFGEVVARRPVVRVMDFLDYDHDGQRSEFYLKTETAPCGKSVGVVVGVSRSNPKLHVFGTASEPTKPLLLQKHIWQALSGAPGSVEIVEWPCGDHGADEESAVRLRATKRGIEGVRREFACPRNPGQHPIREDPL